MKIVRIKHDYTEKGFIKFIKDGAECFWNFWIKHRVLVVDLRAKISYFGSKEVMREREGYDRTEYWTNEKPEKIYEDGYKRCEGLHDNLAWIGVPVFMKFYDVHMIADPDEKDSPRFLYDRAMNNLTTRFAKGLARAQAIAGIDIQKLLLMGGIGIAAIVGMKFLGVF